MFLRSLLTPKEKPAPIETEWAKRDKYYASSLFILSEMAERDKKFKKLVSRYVNITQGLLRFDMMILSAAQWSMSHKILIDLAAHLWNEAYPFKLADLDYLNEEEKRIAAEAIRLRFGLILCM